MDILRLYDDYNVPYVTEGHKHSRPGWINTECPWCTGNPGYHLGYNEDGQYYYCWRCGWHPTNPTLGKLLHVTEREIRTIVTEYGVRLTTIESVPIRQLDFLLPIGTIPLTEGHRRYLESRNYDPDEIIRTWHIMSAGPMAYLNGDTRVVSYRNRIVIPFYWNGKVVSFDTRSTTVEATHGMRYRACIKERESIPHKQILYGRQEQWTERIIVVEGPTDAWRMGVHSVATSGIQFTPQQVRALTHFKQVHILYDPEHEAQSQAERLASELRFRNVDTYVHTITIASDPGSLTQSEADYIVKQLIK